SMGPPFITAEWQASVLSHVRLSGRRFNGAAVHHGGVGVRGAIVAWEAAASMGPPFITAEWKGNGAYVEIADTVLGFNGAAVHHRGVGVQAGHQHEPVLASIGPPFLTAEWPQLPALHALVSHASMGPPFITAEWLVRDWVMSTRRSRGFNGAAVHH